MSDYWLKRALEDEARAHRLAAETSAELKKLYQRQYKRTYAQLERLYGQIDWGDTLTHTQLWQYKSWKSLEKQLRQFATETPRIGIDKITSCLDKVFKETIGRDVGMYGGGTFGHDDTALALINTAWSGETFSARIWKNTAAVAQRIRSDMEDMLIGGRSREEIKLQLMKDFSASYRDASQLVETEAAYVLNGVEKQRYKDAGLQKIRWSIRPEDGKECALCKSRADKVWHIENAPMMPAHPRCRCIWVGVIELPGENVPCDGEEAGAGAQKPSTGTDTATKHRTGLREIELPRRTAGSSGEALKKSPQYGIINTGEGAEYKRILDSEGNEKFRYLQTDAIQKLDSAEAIAEFFRYTDPWGDEHSPIDETFSRLKLNVQKEAAEGIEWARKTYGLNRLPASIQTKSFRDRTIGAYSPTDRILYFRKGLREDEAFVTAIHEMTHFAQIADKISAEEIVEQAKKNLGYSERSKQYKAQKQFIVGIGNTRDVNDATELVAYSLERYAANIANPLAKKITELWLERMMRK